MYSIVRHECSKAGTFIERINGFSCDNLAQAKDVYNAWKIYGGAFNEVIVLVCHDGNAEKELRRHYFDNALNQFFVKGNNQ